MTRASATAELPAKPTGRFVVRSGSVGKVVKLEGCRDTATEAEVLALRTSKLRGLWTLVLEGEWQLHGEPPRIWAFTRRRTVCWYTPQGVRQ